LRIVKRVDSVYPVYSAYYKPQRSGNIKNSSPPRRRIIEQHISAKGFSLIFYDKEGVYYLIA
jgi:hypothetical protein